ncbi:MFS transporter [Candidatus Daviesbacteria bacterium]|nr:MFS transporter [Candidatus Daviesbacteria bacterium]
MRKSLFISLTLYNFRLFWIGSGISQIGNQMQVVAVSWQLYALTHSAVSLGLVGISSFLPILFFSLLGGLAADRIDRKKLLIASQILMAITAAFFTLATYYHFISPILIYILMFFNTSFMIFSAPARQSIIPNLVPKKYFINAMSLSTLSRQSAVVIGPGIAGFMIELFGVQSVYFLNAVSFLILILTLIPLHVNPSGDTRKVAFNFKSIKEGIRFVKSEPVIYSTMVLDFFATFFSSATSLMPIFAVDVLKTGAKGLGFLYSASSVGGIIAGLIISSINHIKYQGRAILLGTLIYGLATIGFGLSGSLPLTLLFLVLVGMGDMTATIVRNTARQLITPDYIRGRMTSINMIFVQGGPKLGDAEAGLLAAAIGAPGSVIVGGIGTLLSLALIGVLFPKLRNYQG